MYAGMCVPCPVCSHKYTYVNIYACGQCMLRAHTYGDMFAYTSRSFFPLLAYSCHTPGPEVWTVATVRSTHPTDSLHLCDLASSAATASCSSGLCFPEGHVRSPKDLQPHSRMVTIAVHTVKEPQLFVSLYEVGTGQGRGQHCSEVLMLPIFVAHQIPWALRAASPDLGRRL